MEPSLASQANPSPDAAPRPASGKRAAGELARSERSREFGAQLRAAREAAGTSVRALSQSTRICGEFIEALEDGDLARLPGEVFGRGFVRSICKTLSLDSGAMIAAYDACWDHSAPRKPVLQVEIKEKPYRVGRVATLLQAAAVRLRPGRSFGRFVGVALLIAGLGAGIAQLRRLEIVKSWRRSLAAATGTVNSTAAAPASVLLSPAAPASVLQSPAAPASVLQPADIASGAASAPAVKPAIAEDSVSTTAPPVDPGPTAGRSATTAEVVASEAASTAATAVQPERETAAVAMTAAGSGDQLLELAVSAPVRIRADVDGSAGSSTELTPGKHEIRFREHVEMMVYDAAAVQISFNGRPIGSLGNKGRVRRIGFQAASPDAKKL